MRCAVDVVMRRRAHRRDDAVDLVERQRRGRQHGRPVGGADGVAQLGGDGGPARVAVAAMQVGASQAAGHAGHHQRPDQTGAVANPHRQVRDPGGVQVAHHPRIGDQVVRQHDEVRGLAR